MRSPNTSASKFSSVPNSSCSQNTHQVSTRHTISTIDKCVPSIQNFIQCNEKHDVSTSFMTCTCDDVNILWHNRLGYVPLVKMREIKSIPENFFNKQPFICSICLMVRQERLTFSHKINTHSSTIIIQLLHTYLWGAHHMMTHDNYRYFITIFDDYSRCTWTQLLMGKSKVLSVIKAFVSMIENQFHTNVQTIRTDNGIEFVNIETPSFLN